eukprot:540445_1
MEDNDDFEFVDNDKSNFDELVDEDTLLCDSVDDGISNNNDELGAISSLNKEISEVKELKKHLKSQCIESSKLLKKLQTETNKTQQLQIQLKKEFNEINNIKLSLINEKEQFVKQKNELTQLLSQMNTIPNTIKKSNNLIQELNTFYTKTDDIKNEIEKLKLLRAQQQEMIDKCKIHIETVNSQQRECLMSLDKSKSYACKECGTDIALKEDIESKCYQVGQGQFTEKKRGYLFETAVNTVLGNTKTENFTTGSYQIAWIKCAKCQTQMGWKYISADNENNISKVGKYCLARYSLMSPEDRSQQK